MHEIVAARCTARKSGERATASGDYGGLFAVASGPGEPRVPRSIDLSVNDIANDVISYPM
jgi:hypothetical protein